MSRLRRRSASRDAPAPSVSSAGVRRAEKTEVVALADAPDRVPVVVEGTLRSVTLRPRGGVPALEAELTDPTGAVTVVWLGRRQITGIGAGTRIRVQGRIGLHDQTRIMYNPRYELMA